MYILDCANIYLEITNIIFITVESKPFTLISFNYLLKFHEYS